MFEQIDKAMCRFPGDFHYKLASPADQEQFLQTVVAPLLALELSEGGLYASERLEQALVAAKAQSVRQWLPEARRKRDFIVEAKRHLASVDQDALRKRLADATVRAESAQRKFDDANGALQVARGEQVAAHHEVERLDNALRLADTQDVFQAVVQDHLSA